MQFESIQLYSTDPISVIELDAGEERFEINKNNEPLIYYGDSEPTKIDLKKLKAQQGQRLSSFPKNLKRN